MKRTLHIFFYQTLFSILVTKVFSLIWMYDNGKRTAADPNLMGEWIALGFVGMLMYWCYAGVLFLIVWAMKGMKLTKSYLNVFMLSLIGVVGVLPTVIIAGTLLIQTPNPFKQYEPVPDIKELIEQSQLGLK